MVEMKALRSLRGKTQRGQGLVEFALILPVLLLVMLGIIEFGYVFTVYSGMFNAAREGTRYGIVNPRDVVGIMDRVRGKLVLVDPAAVTISVAFDKGPGTPTFTDAMRAQIGDRVLVHVRYDLPTITPVIQPIVATLPIRVEAARTIATLGDSVSMPPGMGGGGGGGGDADGDGRLDDTDNCPSNFNPDQYDSDGDGVGNVCDNCPTAVNPRQEDADGDGLGDVCDVTTLALQLRVTANPMTIHAGDMVQFTYAVTNTGDTALDVLLTDTFGNTIALGTLAAGATTNRNVSQAIGATMTNDVTATGTEAGGGTATRRDSVVITVIRPGIDLSVVVQPAMIGAGGVAVFTYTVQNTGDVALTTVSVVDRFGTTLSSSDLAAGQYVFWRLPYQLFTTTTNLVTAVGVDGLGGSVSDGEEALVQVVRVYAPIVIQEPLIEGNTSVGGTAEPGETVRIRNLMSDTFPALTAVVQANGAFQFTNLPPLIAGHVILVEGYGKYDSASVAGGNYNDIVISEPVCHGNMSVSGAAHPGKSVSLLIVETNYQDATTVNAGGNFVFNLPADQPVQQGQTIQIGGYGKSDTTTVQACTTNAYITISPQCGPVGSTNITVKGYNWKYQNSNDNVTIKWGGLTLGTSSASGTPATWQKTFVVNVTAGNHTVSASNKKVPAVTAKFVSPCPSPNLIVSNLELLTTGPISTYQPLNFRATVQNNGSRSVNTMFWVDLYDEDPETSPTGIAWVAVNGLNAGQSVPVVITLREGFDSLGSYSIWAAADSWEQVTELNEFDNDFGPLTVNVTREGTPPPPPPVTGTVGSLVGETWIALSGPAVPQGRANVLVYNGSSLVASTVSDGDGRYGIADLPVGTYTVIGETWVSGVRYSNTYSGVVIAEGQTTVQLIIMRRN